MANKSTTRHMRLNIEFISDVTKLAKDLSTLPSKVDLGSKIGKDLVSGFTKNIGSTIGNLNKLQQALSVPGLSTKQYTAIFNKMNVKIQETAHQALLLKDSLKDLYNSQENKDGLKQLEKFKKQLEEIKDLQTKKSGSVTRRNTSKKKLFEEAGLDYNQSKVREQLLKMQRQLGAKKGITKDDKAWLENFGLSEKDLTRVLELVEQIEQHTKNIVNLDKKGKKMTGASTLEGSEEFLNNKIQEYEEGYFTSDKYKAAKTAFKDYAGMFGDFENQINGFNDKFGRATSSAEHYNATMIEGEKTLAQVGRQLGIVNFGATEMIRMFKKLIVEAFNFYKSLDYALNQIYVVSNLSSGAVNQLTSEFVLMAKNTGMAIDDVTKAAVLFFQQGLDTEEVMEMTEVTAQFAKVAGIDAANAADKLTAAVNGYCMEAEEAMSVADKFNKVAAASAADINELSTAFSKAAAQANQAGVGMDNYLAYIATMVEATREAPENIGTSLKTIFSRMQQVKEAGTTEDGETDVNQVETALESVGIALRDVNGELRDLEDVFDELGPKWESLDRNTQAYLGTIIAGTRQQSRFITLMQNWDRVQDLAEQSANSAGQQALMHAKAMDSITSKMQEAKVAMQEFTSNLTNSAVIKDLIKLFTKFFDMFNDGSKPITLVTLAIVAMGKQINKLQAPLVNAGKGLFTSLRQAWAPSSERQFKSQSQKDMAIARSEAQRLAKIQEIERLEKEIAYHKDHGNKKEAAAANRRKKEAEDDLKYINKNLKRNQNGVTPGSQMGAKLQTIGNGMMVGGMALSSYDATLGGMVSGAGSLATGIGQMMIPGQRLAGIISTIMGLYQLSTTWADREKAALEKLNGAIDKVSQSAAEAANLMTGVRSTEALLKEYQELSNVIVKTTKEQERFNDIARELSETHGIDLLTDSFGNASINIKEARAALEELELKRDEAIEKLKDEEGEQADKATSGLFTDSTYTQFYDKLLTKNRSEYKALLQGVDDEMEEGSRLIGDNAAREFSDTFKTSLYEHVDRNALYYAGETTVGAMTRLDESINKKLDKKDWNEIYKMIAELQDMGNDLSFAEAEERLQHFYDTWGKANGVTLEEWEVLKNSINNTVFENSSLLEFFAKVEEMREMMGDNKNDTVYDELSNNMDKRINELKASTADESVLGGAGLVAGAGAAGLILANFWNPIGWVAAGVTFVAGVTSAIAAYHTEEQKELRRLQGVQDELEKKRKDYLKQLDEDNEWIEGEKETERFVEAIYKLDGALKSASKSQATYLGSLANLTNFDNLGAKAAEQYADIIQKAMQGMGTYSSDGEYANYMLEYLGKMLDDPNLAPELRIKLEALMQEVWDTLDVPTSSSWTDLAKQLDTISEKLRTVNTLTHDIIKNGGMTLDQFIQLAEVMDSISAKDLIDLQNLGDGVDYLSMYVGALDNLQLGYNEITGQIEVNGDYMKTMQKIQQGYMQVQLRSMKAEIQARNAQLQSQLDYIKAQRVGTQAAIKAVKTDSDGKITASEIIAEANAYVGDTYGRLTEETLKAYKAQALGAAYWSTTVVAAAEAASKAMGKYYKALKDRSYEEGSFDELYNKAIEEAKKADWTGGGYINNYRDPETGELLVGPDGEIDISDPDKQQKLVNYLLAYDKELVQAYGAILLEQKKNQEMIDFIDSLDGDLSKLGLEGAEALEKYISKLKELSNILEHIEREQANLKFAGKLKDMQKGAAVIRQINKELEYTRHLQKDTEDAYLAYEGFANAKAQSILKGYGDVVSFDEWGNYNINWDAYNQLDDEHKKNLDEELDKYKELINERDTYYEDHLQYLQDEIELEQEKVDAYIKAEDTLVEAIKEREKRILDNKLAAIDKEKEAIKEASDARKKAREEEEEAQELSELQTDLQRALMDSSGASATQILEIQKQIKEKQQGIADNSFDQMVSDMNDQLEEEKKLEQALYDERLEEMDWYWAEVDRIMAEGTDKVMETMKLYNDEFNKSSKLQQQELLNGWTDVFEQAAAVGLIGAMEYQKIVKGLQDQINGKDVDENILADNIINTEFDKRPTLPSTNTGGTSGGSSGGNSGGKGKDNYGSDMTWEEWLKKADEESKPDDADIDLINKRKTFTGQFDSIVKVGDTIEFKPGNGNSVKGSKDVNGATGYTAFTDQKGSDQDFKYEGGIQYAPNFPAPNGDTGAWVARFSRRDPKGGRNPHAREYWWFPLSKNGLDAGAGKIWYHNDSQWVFKHGGMVDHTGPAWLDGTRHKPEAVLNALQTKAFLSFTKDLAELRALGGTGFAPSVYIDTISFNVDSMSSAEDGKIAFDAFVDEFKRLGSRQGISIQGTANRL
jgi:TP901 family phage tail tape measure protein